MGGATSVQVEMTIKSALIKTLSKNSLEMHPPTFSVANTEDKDKS